MRVRVLIGVTLETDGQKRLTLVWQIQRKLEEDGERPTMGWRVDR